MEIIIMENLTLLDVLLDFDRSGRALKCALNCGNEHWYAKSLIDESSEDELNREIVLTKSGIHFVDDHRGWNASIPDYAIVNGSWNDKGDFEEENT